MGTVHRARDEFWGRDVAVKLNETPVVREILARRVQAFARGR
ncbi:MAG: hypothetical protein ABIP19_13940 [Dermatophilaceae bacterium]